MPHQGQKKGRRAPECIAESLKQCMQRLFDSKSFHDVKFAEQCTWTSETLAAASLVWTWSDDSTLTERFSTARTLTISAFQIPEHLSSADQPFMRMQCRWSADLVDLWTDKAAAASQPPLVLRFVVLNKAKKKIYFVTSVRSAAVLSNKEVLQIAKSRRGVELFFSIWIQTFDKRKLRSHKSEHALIELDWSLIGLWGVCLLAQLENRDLQPSKLSVARLCASFSAT